MSEDRIFHEEQRQKHMRFERASENATRLSKTVAPKAHVHEWSIPRLLIVLLLALSTLYALAPRQAQRVEGEQVLDGMNYTGALENQRFTGGGRLETQSGIFEGTFDHGLPEGRGHFTAKDWMLDGVWHEGELVGPLRVTFQNKSVWERDASGAWHEVTP